MKLYILFFLLFSLLIYSCRTNPDKVIMKVPGPENHLMGQLFKFSPTNDPLFCNKDSIIEGDCFTGFIYFTPKGKVIFREDCVNDVTASYLIGIYKQNNQGIICNFSEMYTFDVEQEEINPDKGKMTAMDTFSLHLRNASCKGMYGIREKSEKNQYYYSLVEPADDDLSGFFMDEYRQISKLKSY